MYKIRCGEIWGGITGQALDCQTSGISASLFSQACDGGKGGDVYYFSVCEGDQLTRIVIADVMGHGERVSKTSQWLYDSLHQQMNSADGSAILEQVNKEAVEFGFDAFSTATVAAFYRTDHKLYYSYAGHHPIIVYRRQEQRWSEYGLPAVASEDLVGLPLAVDADSRYQQEAIPLAEGDKLVIYTDGVIEAPDPNGTLWGTSRLLSVLNQNALASTVEIRDAVLQSLHTHTDNNLSHDDVTLIVAEILPH